MKAKKTPVKKSESEKSEENINSSTKKDRKKSTNK
jgi:hypothetical protein